MFIMAPCSKIWAHACNNRQRELYFCNLELLLQLIKQEEKHNQATTACCYYRILFPPKITVAGNATHGTDFCLFFTTLEIFRSKFGSDQRLVRMVTESEVCLTKT